MKARCDGLRDAVRCSTGSSGRPKSPNPQRGPRCRWTPAPEACPPTFGRRCRRWRLHPFAPTSACGSGRRRRYRCLSRSSPPGLFLSGARSEVPLWDSVAIASCGFVRGPWSHGFPPWPLGPRVAVLVAASSGAPLYFAPYRTSRQSRAGGRPEECIRGRPLTSRVVDSVDAPGGEAPSRRGVLALRTSRA
jgi:hypothetical protein